MRTRTLGACLTLVAVLSSASLEAAPGRRDPSREGPIERDLAALSPEAVPVFREATAALDAGQWEKAEAGYRRVLELAPHSDAALRRLGSCLVETGRPKEGLELTEKALALRRSPENLFSVALDLTVPLEKGKDEPPPGALTRALALASEAARARPDDPDYQALKARVALSLDDRAAFREAVGVLRTRFPDRVTSRYFEAIRAALDEEWGTAEKEILAARRLGLDQEAVDRFLATGVGSRARAFRWASYVGLAAAAWALGLAVLFVAGKLLSKLTLASIERDDPNQAVSPQAARLRAAYRRVVSVAGLYWYVSQPFVALLVVAAAAAVIYGFLAIGRIPIKLTAILVIGTLVSLWALVRSLFVRVRDDEDPGRAVTDAEAPRLWETTREVAAAVGTRPVDEIWLTPGTDLAVMERGSARERMGDRARRALLLGAGVLDGFDQGAFRAVLAHEYGHFAHRDTAGGDVAFRVRAGIRAFAIALARAGYAVWWNLAFQFLRLFDLLFRRISHGATRLQEVLADRVAIQRYGLEAFRTGLTHVVARSVRFEQLADAEIRQAVEERRGLANLYALAAAPSPEVEADLDRRVAAELDAETTEDNTHPAPKERFRLGERIISTATYEPGGPVWDLFLDRDALTAEMTAAVARSVAADTEAPVTG